MDSIVGAELFDLKDGLKEIGRTGIEGKKNAGLADPDSAGGSKQSRGCGSLTNHLVLFLGVGTVGSRTSDIGHRSSPLFQPPSWRWVKSVEMSFYA